MKKFLMIFCGLIMTFIIYFYVQHYEAKIDNIHSIHQKKDGRHSHGPLYEIDHQLTDDIFHDDSHDEYEPIEKDIVQKQSIPFTLNMLDGKRLTLAHLKGKKVLLNFWTTWCPPCQEEMPQIQSYYETYSKKHNMEVVAINITDQDSGVDVIKQFADYYHLTFPIVLDEKGEVSKKYEVLTIPTSFLLDEEGKMIKKIVGPVTEEMLVHYFQ